MAKYICCMNDTENLKNLDRRLNEARKSFDEVMGFVKKSMEDAENRFREEGKLIWQAIHEELKALGKIDKDYSADSDGTLTINKEDLTMFWMSDEEHMRQRVAEKIMDGMPKELVEMITK